MTGFIISIVVMAMAVAVLVVTIIFKKKTKSIILMQYFSLLTQLTLTTGIWLSIHLQPVPFLLLHNRTQMSIGS